MQTPPAVQLPLRDELAEVDTIINRSVAAGDPMIAAEYGNQLHRAAFLKGVSLAKLLYGLRDKWSLFQAAGIEEEFEEFVEAHFINLDHSTASRYANMYESVFVIAPISDRLRMQLSIKPIRSLLLLTAGVREGSIGADDLQEAVLRDESGIRAIVRRARGHQTKSSKAIYAKIVTRPNSTWGPPGTIIVFQDGDTDVLGVLNTKPQKEFSKQYLERMKNIMGIGDL